MRTRKVAYTVVGGLVTLVGIALLALPGPGLVVVVLGLGILAKEYAWARRLLTSARDQLRTELDQVGRSKGRAALYAAAGAVLVLVGVGCFVFPDLPLASPTTGAFVILGGLFTAGSSLYARVTREPAGARL